MMNKKGSLYYLILFGGIVALLIIGGDILGRLSFQEPLGHSANMLMQLDSELAYNHSVREANLRLSLWDVKKKFYAQGGFSTIPACGLYEDYYAYVKGNDLCIPTSKDYGKFLETEIHSDYAMSLIHDRDKDLIYAVKEPEKFIWNTTLHPGEKSLQEKELFSDKDYYLTTANMNLYLQEDAEPELFTAANAFAKQAEACYDASCVNGLISSFSYGPYKVSEDCENDVSSAISQFLEMYLSCLDSYYVDCTCTFPIPSTDKKLNITFSGDKIDFGERVYEPLPPQESEIVEDAQYPDKNLLYDNGFYSEDQISVIIKDGQVQTVKTYEMQNNKLRVKDEFTPTKLQFYRNIDTRNLDPEVSKKTGIASLGLLRSPGNYKTCALPQLTKWKLCIDSKKNHLYKEKGTYVSAPLTLKFAVIGKPEPPKEQVHIISVGNKVDAENKVELVFAPVPDPNVYLYRIYFDEDKINSVQGRTEFIEWTPDRNMEQSADPITVDVTVPHDGTYWFAVTPVNNQGLENKNVVAKEGTSEDNVAPAAVEVRIA